VQLTVVVPTYNEAENLPRLVEALFALPLLQLKMLIVDDNSPDGTGDLAEQLALEHTGRLSVIHRAGKLWLGTAYKEGFQRALADGAKAVAQMDADFSHPPEKLVEMAQALQGADAVIGSRYVTGGSVDVNWPLWRKGLSAFGNFYARTILGLHIRDATGGFRLWRRETLQNMCLERSSSSGYAFQVEVAYMAERLGYRFKEIPIYFADRRWGKSKMSFRIQCEAAVKVWQMRSCYRDLHPLQHAHGQV
jgi:dolichol-phosphate mannosyltransferase